MKGSVAERAAIFLTLSEPLSARPPLERDVQERTRLEREKQSLQEKLKSASVLENENKRLVAENKHMTRTLAAAEKEVKALQQDVEKLADDNKYDGGKYACVLCAFVTCDCSLMSPQSSLLPNFFTGTCTKR